MAARRVSANLGAYRAVIDRGLEQLETGRIMARIWAHDYRVWKESPSEITDRLGWLHCAADMEGNLAAINALAATCRAEGYRHALLLGMGGSSLAPEVFRKTFGVKNGYLDLSVLDSTDPGMVLDYANNLDLNKTLFIVSTKSGGTVETLSFLRYFYNRTASSLGEEHTGAHFIAITDPGSALEELACSHCFRKVFLNDPHIGGRYSALSYFGLVPAALIGMDIKEFLARSATIAEEESGGAERLTDGAFLGVIMGELAKAGRDKVTFVLSPGIAAFGVWLEQLIAESTGKEGKGLLPVVDEPLRNAADYANDRVFVFLHLKGDKGEMAVGKDMEKAGHPVVSVEISDLYDLGAQCFLWELATVVAGACLGINPFDQPDVEKAKKLAGAMVARYREEGALPAEAPVLERDGIAVYGDGEAATPKAALISFLKRAEPGAYASLQAYIRPMADTEALLAKLRRTIGTEFGIATTLGYGPRFLHSTGQLHKGDGGRGLFIQFTVDDVCDAPIPDVMGKAGSSVTFGILKAAQALGDRQALVSAGRQAIRFHLGKDAAGGLRKLLE